MSGFDNYWIEREAWRGQVAENSGRLAFAWGTSTTTGAGGLVHDKQIDFGLSFVEKPMFQYGFEVLNKIDYKDPNDIVPSSSGFVFDWTMSATGLYTGAHVGVYTYCNDDTEIEHHFGFIGVGIKVVGNGDDV